MKFIEHFLEPKFVRGKKKVRAKSLRSKNSCEGARAERAILGVFGQDRRAGVAAKNWKNGAPRKFCGADKKVAKNGAAFQAVNGEKRSKNASV